MLGSGAAIQFLGHSVLIVDHGAQFGVLSGTGPFAGPLLQDFGSGDQIDFGDVRLAGARMAWQASSGIMSVLNAAGEPRWGARIWTPPRWARRPSR